jgi:hypothetical protein
MLLTTAVTTATTSGGGRGNGHRRNGGSGEKGLAKHGNVPRNSEMTTEMVDAVQRKCRASDRTQRFPVVNRV